MAEPKHNKGNSQQVFSTPDDFIAAVKEKLHIDAFKFDFAANADNAKADRYWSEVDDSLSKSPWEWVDAIGDPAGWGWLNPPFADIAPWARRCAEAGYAGANIALLIPAAVGANYYQDFIEPHAQVYALNGRLAFMPDKPRWLYPKDCLLALFGRGAGWEFETWSWRRPRKRAELQLSIRP